MEDLFFEDQVFDKVDFSEQALQTGEYERCTFTGCNFTGVDLSDFKFADCSFVICNLSMVKLVKTALRTVVFKDCKMLGARFDECSKFGLELRFENCNLSHCSFYQVNLKKAVFKNTQLIEADLTQCDLSNAVLDACDLMHASFDNTLLEKADLRTSFNYSIDPERNRIKKAKFSQTGIAGLLDKYDIEISLTS